METVSHQALLLSSRTNIKLNQTSGGIPTHRLSTHYLTTHFASSDGS